MKKTTLFFIFLFVSISVFATKGKTESDTTLIATKDTAVVKKEFKQYRNFIGLDLLGTIGKLSYNRYFIIKEKFQIGYNVSINSVTFVGTHFKLISPSFGINIQASVYENFFVFSQIGIETFSFAFPTFSKKNTGIDFFVAAPTFDLGTSMEFKRLKINPVVFSIARSYQIFKFMTDSYKTFVPYNIFYIRTTLAIQF